jgi:phosphoglycolate phosphatase
VPPALFSARRVLSPLPTFQRACRWCFRRVGSRCSAGELRLACVTNKPREFTLDLLERVGLLGYFEAVISGDDTTEKKPHAAPLLAACKKLDVAAGEAVMIGDSENDLLSARAAGCRAILVEGGYNEGQPVASLPADAIVETLVDAVALSAPSGVRDPVR